MKAEEKAKIKEFGNPSAYYDNRLYKIFSEEKQDDTFYRMVYYGQRLKVPDEIILNKNYKELLKKKIEYQQERVNRISKIIKTFREPSVWLDLGCGVGQFIEKISKLEGNFVIGSDTSYFALKKADYILRKYSSARDFFLINQDESGLPFKDNSFDYILSADVLEHIGYENQNKFFSEMYRVLKNSGKVIIHTPNLNRVIVTTLLKKMFYLFKGFNPKLIGHSFPKDHISLVNAAHIKRLSSSVGFKAKIFKRSKENYKKLSFLYILKLEYFFPKSITAVLSK